MCKAYEYVYTNCSHKHVKQIPCLGTTKVPTREGGERVFCTSVSIKVNEAKKEGRKDKTFLKGDIITVHLDQACPACAKHGILMRKAQKVVALSDRYEGLGWSNYAQAKIDDSLVEYQRVKERLDGEVTLLKPDGIFDYEFPGRPRFRHR